MVVSGLALWVVLMYVVQSDVFVLGRVVEIVGKWI
jgi:hypothetical protein